MEAVTMHSGYLHICSDLFAFEGTRPATLLTDQRKATRSNLLAASSAVRLLSGAHARPLRVGTSQETDRLE